MYRPAQLPNASCNLYLLPAWRSVLDVEPAPPHGSQTPTLCPRCTPGETLDPLSLVSLTTSVSHLHAPSSRSLTRSHSKSHSHFSLSPSPVQAALTANSCSLPRVLRAARLTSLHAHSDVRGSFDEQTSPARDFQTATTCCSLEYNSSRLCRGWMAAGS